MITATLDNHVPGALTDFGRELHGLLRGSIFSRVREALNKSLFQGQKAVRRLVDASFFCLRGFEVDKLA